MVVPKAETQGESMEEEESIFVAIRGIHAISQILGSLIATAVEEQSPRPSATVANLLLSYFSHSR